MSAPQHGYQGGRGSTGNTGGPVDTQKPTHLPEAVNLATSLWWAMVAAELLRSLSAVVYVGVSPQGTLAHLMSSGAMNQEQIDMLNSLGPGAARFIMVLYMGTYFMIVALFMGLVSWMNHSLRNASPRSERARKLLFLFGIYFTVRAVFVFVAPTPIVDPTSWFFLVDGALQIIIGCMAAVTIVLFNRKETVTWLDGLRQGSHSRK